MKPVWSFLIGLLLLAGTPLLPVPSGPLRLPTPAPAPSPAPAPAPGPATPSTVTAAVYVYEKDESFIPVGVSAAINKLNRDKKITATLFEKDTIDGTGKTPAQYQAALEAARRESIPALVVLSGTTVVRVVKAPKNEAEVLAAIH